MTKTRTQYRAECSCCGREQAVDGAGRIADHGYTLDYGWRNGRCEGSRRPHFGTKEGRDFRKSISDSLVESSIKTHAKADAAERGTINLQKMDKVTKQMVTLTGRDLEQAVYCLRRDSQQMFSEAKRMAISVDLWVERFPRAVEVETAKAPMVHFHRERWGKWCAGSAMGALKGHTSTNWDHVNCPKCIARREYFAKQGKAV
jgi:hypothetical protein